MRRDNDIDLENLTDQCWVSGEILCLVIKQENYLNTNCPWSTKFQYHFYYDEEMYIGLEAKLSDYTMLKNIKIYTQTNTIYLFHKNWLIGPINWHVINWTLTPEFLVHIFVLWFTISLKTVNKDYAKKNIYNRLNTFFHH